MTDQERREKVIKGLECHFLIEMAPCEKCPYYCKESCTDELAKDALALLKAQEAEPTKFQIKTTISNVEIPKDIDEEQFMMVLSQQYAALARLYGDDAER